MAKNICIILHVMQKKALTLRNNSDFITIHSDLIVFSMYIYIYISLFFQCNGISKLLLRFSKLTYYNFFSFLLLSRVLYVVYVSVENYVLCTRLK